MFYGIVKVAAAKRRVLMTLVCVTMTASEL